MGSKVNTARVPRGGSHETAGVRHIRGDSQTEAEGHDIISSRCVDRWEENGELRSRLCSRGYESSQVDPASLFAALLRVLMLMFLSLWSSSPASPCRTVRSTPFALRSAATVRLLLTLLSRARGSRHAFNSAVFRLLSAPASLLK